MEYLDILQCEGWLAHTTVPEYHNSVPEVEEDEEDSDDVNCDDDESKDDDDEDGDDVDGGDLLRPLLPVLETWPPLLPPRPDILEPDQDYHQKSILPAIIGSGLRWTLFQKENYLMAQHKQDNLDLFISRMQCKKSHTNRQKKYISTSYVNNCLW